MDVHLLLWSILAAAEAESEIWRLRAEDFRTTGSVNPFVDVRDRFQDNWRIQAYQSLVCSNTL